MNIFPDDFDYIFYKFFYKDLINFNNDELKNHYLIHGYKENRMFKLPNDFSPSFYKNLYNDLKNLSDEEAKNHFIIYGINEKRIYKDYIKNESNFSFKNKPLNWNNLALYEKIQFTKNKFGKNYSSYVDKIEAKNIVKNLCGDKIKIPVVKKIFQNYKDITQDDLHHTFIIKGAHSCGANIVLFPEPEPYDIPRLHRVLEEKFNKKYTLGGESQYDYLEPKFFTELKIHDKQFGMNGNAITYMIRCIHGIPYTLTILDKKNGYQEYYLYNIDKTIKEIDMKNSDIKPIGFNYDLMRPDKNELKKMYDLASILSTQFEFVRIDFYISKNSDIYFSEFTFTPNAGGRVYDLELEIMLGKLWK